MTDGQKPRTSYAYAALIAFWPLLTWAVLVLGTERYAHFAVDEFYDPINPIPGWEIAIAHTYMLSPALILSYPPNIAALVVCVVLLQRRPKIITLRTLFIGFAGLCLVLAIAGQARNAFATSFAVFAVSHALLSIGLTVWLVREVRTLLDALSKASRE